MVSKIILFFLLQVSVFVTGNGPNWEVCGNWYDGVAWYYYLGTDSIFVCDGTVDKESAKLHELWHWFYYRKLNDKWRKYFGDSEEFAEAFRFYLQGEIPLPCGGPYDPNCLRQMDRIRKAGKLIRYNYFQSVYGNGKIDFGIWKEAGFDG